MTDNLRDRIADVLFANFMRQAVSRGVADCMADAVIEALDLAKPCVTAGCRMRRMTREGFKYGERYGI
jgi:hypothetical protein